MSARARRRSGDGSGHRPHFFVEDIERERVALTPADSRHALRSLRLRTGDLITLADGRGTVAVGRLVTARGGPAVAEVSEPRRVKRPSPGVTVLLSPPKGDRLSWAVQKLAELGVDETLLIRTERSVRSWDEVRAGHLLERLGSVAREGAMQSRQAFVMRVGTGGDLAESVGEGDREGVKTFLMLEGASGGLFDALPEEISSVTLLVGPEGGFGEEEIRSALGAGALEASLGPNILRTETAAIVSAALVLARYGRLG